MVEPKYQVLMLVVHRFPAILVVSDQGAEAGVNESTDSLQHSDHYRRDSSKATFIILQLFAPRTVGKIRLETRGLFLDRISPTVDSLEF